MTGSDIHTEYNVMHCHIIYVRYAMDIERNIDAPLAAIQQLRYIYSTRTHVFDVSQLLALHVFHIRPTARIPLGHDGSSVCFAFCCISWQLDNKRSIESTRCTPWCRHPAGAAHQFTVQTKNLYLLRHCGFKTEDWLLRHDVVKRT